MNQRLAKLSVSAVLVFFPILVMAQMAGGMHGGGNTGVANGTGGMMSGLAGTMEGMGVMSGHDVMIGPDGVAFILDPDLSVAGSPRTSITAVSPRTTRASEWKITVAGLVHEIAAGADRLIVSAIPEGFMGSTGSGNSGMHGTNSFAAAAVKSKLYFLNAADGSVVRTVEHDGLGTSLVVRKVDSAEYVYLVTREPFTTGGGTMSGASRVKLTIYRPDGSVVKAVDLAADTILGEP